ncbi:SUMF1/EgtB/PvdO family nonheme iron enzyme [Spirochaetota bacterium]
MKGPKITTALIICSAIFFSFNCGDNPIENARDFTENRPPAITEFTSSPEIANELVPGMIFSISASADDPEGRNLDYEFISENGSFMNRIVSGNSASIDFITGNILPGQSVTIKVTVIDHKNLSVSRELILGTGKTGPTITQTGTANTFVREDGAIGLNCRCDSSGYYQVQVYDSTGAFLLGNPDNTWTEYIKDEDINATIAGPLSGIMGGNIYKLQADGNFTVRFTCRDGLWQEASLDLNVLLDRDAPVINAQTIPARNSRFLYDADVDDAFGISSYTWEKLSGPGDVTFGSPDSEDTTIEAAIDGNYTVRLTAADFGGNSVYRDIDFTWDTEPPVVQLSSTPPGLTVQSGFSITVDSSVVTSYRYKLNDSGWSSEVNASVSIDGTDLTDGTYTIYVTGKDSAGNWQAEENATAYTWEVNGGGVFIVGGVTFKMKYCPGGTFPTGIDDSGNDTVDPFYIGETEVTYELWSTVHTWAIANGYNFANNGTMGSGGPGLNNLHPVTEISWVDSIIWCNAISEMSGLTPVYTYSGEVLMDPRDIDSGQFLSITADTMSTGYRLPFIEEWECAGRYIGTINPGYGIEMPLSSGIFWTPGSYASGATDNTDNATATGLVAVYDTNGTSEVKAKIPNQLGIYDMSGNVIEWSNNQTGRGCELLGGSWFANNYGIQIGDKITMYSTYTSIDFGLRITRSQ